MATAAPNKDAAKVAKLREMAKDKSLPQDVRNTYLDEANKLEEKAAKGAGVKLAKGGSVKKMMYGGMAEKPMMAKGGAVKKPAGKTMMAKGGAVKAKKGGK